MKAEKNQANRMQNQESQIKIDKNRSWKTNERHVNGGASSEKISDPTQSKDMDKTRVAKAGLTKHP
jgi:hypothetical protein